MKAIETRKAVNATVRLPGSKSMTHRALIAAALARGPSDLQGALFSEDTAYTLEALRAMGACIERKDQALAILGADGRLTPPGPAELLFLGNSGTSMRLLLSVAALGEATLTLDGSPRMRERPIAPLAAALRTLGAEIAFLGKEGCPPLRVKAHGLSGGTVHLPGSESSQYLSSLLLAAPYAREDLRLEVQGPLMSRPYVDMTLAVMQTFGAATTRDGYSAFLVRAGRGYLGRSFRVEADVSSASYFWAAAAVTGGCVTTPHIRPFDTLQGDIAFLDLLEAMGCTVEKSSESVTVRGGALKGIEADMSAMPDMVPTLAAVAPFAEGPTTIRNVPHLRFKESDRLHAVAMEWNRLGAMVEELEDGLIIPGGQRLQGALTDPHNDHRLAMSLAVMGLRTAGLRIRNEDCVEKSFPGFWPAFDRL